VAVRHRVATAVGEHGRDFRRQRSQRADGYAVGARVGAEDGVRVMVLTCDDTFDLAEGDRFVLR
jgi:hypothetical protein